MDEPALLAKLAALPIGQWRYTREAEGPVHVGPVAEDLRDVLGLGDGEHISTVDASGVALASIKALHREMHARNAALEQQNAALRQQLERLTSVESRLAGAPRLAGPDQASQ